jgi:hypothetical protein
MMFEKNIENTIKESGLKFTLNNQSLKTDMVTFS